MTDDAKRMAIGIADVRRRYCRRISVSDMGRPPLRNRSSANDGHGLRWSGWFVEELGMGERASAVAEVRVTINTGQSRNHVWFMIIATLGSMVR